jgi:hypothetical protein
VLLHRGKRFQRSGKIAIAIEGFEAASGLVKKRITLGGADSFKTQTPQISD